MKIPLILAKVSVLRFHPEWVDGQPILGHPGGPIFRTALTEYVIAGLIREIGLNLSGREFVPKLQQTAKELVAEASKRLPASFESGETDDLCPPYWRHYPPPPHGGRRIRGYQVLTLGSSQALSPTHGLRLQLQP